MSTKTGMLAADRQAAIVPRALGGPPCFLDFAAAFTENLLTIIGGDGVRHEPPH